MNVSLQRFVLGYCLLAATLQAMAALPEPRAVAYPGVIALDVDVTDVQRHLIRVTEVLPVKPGKLTLLYPQWLPGNHAPRGPIDQVAGLVFEANGKPLAWQRDPVDVYAFHLEVPKGASSLKVDFQVATPQGSDQGRVVFTSTMLNLQWNQVLLYPAGYYASGIVVEASVQLPPEWKQASALSVKSSGDVVRFAPTTLEGLVDSPLFAGRYTGALDLAPGAGVPVRLNLFAEAAADLAPTPAQLETHRALVREAYLALGPPRYDHYDFLVALSEQIGGIGLEHHRSSENALPPGYFRQPETAMGRRDLLAHEYTHSWNGKYRRPADLWTPAFSVPMQDSLLWVYEGMTEYYGMVLAARSGLWPQEFAREAFAVVAANYDAKRPGRSWRPLADTTNQPIVTARRPLAWVSWQRSEDYYAESALVWLGVDATLRGLSGGAKGLDAMANAFLAAPATQGTVSTYRYEDVVSALTAVAPYDWKDHLDQRVYRVAAPLDGPTLAGVKLVYDERPNAEIKDAEAERKHTDLGYGLGIVVSKDAALTEVVWESPAFKAGLTVGTTLVAINGRGYSGELLKEAVMVAKTAAAPLELLVKNQDRYRTVSLDYHGGLRYPHLEPVAGLPDRLAEILKPRRP
jgi:predicted metalloprotease with PDZ domain